jgi:4-hydroxy-tetrahydrodipicolinate synthase
MAGEQAGAEGLLVVTPYYNKPTQEGLYRHFKAIAESVSIPIILYNVPGRTAANIEPATVKRLSKIHNIVAIKEASGNLAQMMKIRQLCGDSITLLSGDDGLNLPIFSIGGQGTISVTANIIPDRLKQLNVLWQTGKSTEALAAHMAMLELHDVMFIEANPVPVKTALHLMNKIQLEFRAPLCEMTEQNLKSLQSVLKDQKLI